MVLGNADSLADYADILAMAPGHRVAGQPAELVLGCSLSSRNMKWGWRWWQPCGSTDCERLRRYRSSFAP